MLALSTAGFPVPFILHHSFTFLFCLTLSNKRYIGLPQYVGNQILSPKHYPTTNRFQHSRCRFSVFNYFLSSGRQWALLVAVSVGQLLLARLLHIMSTASLQFSTGGLRTPIPWRLLCGQPQDQRYWIHDTTCKKAPLSKCQQLNVKMNSVNLAVGVQNI